VHRARERPEVALHERVLDQPAHLVVPRRVGGAEGAAGPVRQLRHEVALGGGVVGDLTGFVAATYLRGVRFLQVPTTLLSMVDSSIGGKTGVDYKAYKNMVGAFHQPKLVYMNLSVLNSLPDREYYSGMGEIIKHGLIKDAAYYSWLKENHTDISNKKYEILEEMIYRSCLVKKAVVEKDPKELGDRALLNFGHTIGHSVEKLKNFTLLHGECVCVGMAAAAFISMKRDKITLQAYEDIIETIKLFREPVNICGLSAEQIYEVTKLDKKMDSDKIRFILLQDIGNSEIDPTVTKDEMLAAIHTIII
jgi:3-dehydroquinate synthase